MRGNCTTVALANLSVELRRVGKYAPTRRDLLVLKISRWILCGDRNTKFFHRSAIIRRMRNQILALKDSSDNWVMDKGQLEEMVVRYFAEYAIWGLIKPRMWMISSPSFIIIVGLLCESRFALSSLIFSLRAPCLDVLMLLLFILRVRWITLSISPNSDQ
ncbi:LOW QUALITY PROTEIN: hypothetical protein V2J09_023117 [Rumex salicifolius]